MKVTSSTFSLVNYKATHLNFYRTELKYLCLPSVQEFFLCLTSQQDHHKYVWSWHRRGENKISLSNLLFEQHSSGFEVKTLGKSTEQFTRLQRKLYWFKYLSIGRGNTQMTKMSTITLSLQTVKLSRLYTSQTGSLCNISHQQVW